MRQALHILACAFFVVSMVAVPIAGTASATDSQPAATTEISPTVTATEINEDCDPVTRFALPRYCMAAEYVFGSIDGDREASLVKTDLHVAAQGTYENLQQFDSVYSNYLQDTETLASLEARKAIADAYENGQTVSEAQANSTQAINDYYAVKEIQVLEIMSAQSAEISHYTNVSHQHSNIDNEFIYHWALEGEDGNIYSGSFEGTTVTQTYTLANGSTHQYTVPEHNWEADGDYNGYVDEQIDLETHWYSGAEEFRFNDPISSHNVYWDGGVGVHNHPDAGLESEMVYDYRQPAMLLDEIDQQAQTVQDNYPDTLAEDLYAAMDSGDLTPSDVRGAEGMVRYLSGDQTEGTALELALRHTLDLNHPEDMGAEMVVHFNGSTDRERIANPDGSVNYNYTTLDQELTGILFATSFPDGTAETGVTYNVSNFSSASMLTGSGEKIFWDGEFTITEMYDSDGQPIDTMEYSGPQYQTYNASDYIAALEDVSITREQIVTQDDSSSDGWKWTGLPTLDSGLLPDPPLIAIGVIVVGYYVVARD